MADTTTDEVPPQPQPNGSDGMQYGEPEAMTVVNPDDHHDSETNGISLAPDSAKSEKAADASSGSHQDGAPITGVNTHTNTTPTPTPTPAPVVTTPAPAAAVSAAAASAGSPARAPTPVKAEPSGAAAAVAMPAEPAAHGAPTRVYLNTKVTQHVMEGMKLVALNKPDQPLRVLGEFLLQRSQELEGGPVTSATEEDQVPAADESMKDAEH